MVSIPTVSAFRKLDDAARFALAQQLEASNSAFRAEGVLLGEGRLCQLTHIATGLPFVLVPGGRLGMGLDDAELVAAASRAGGGPMARDCLELLRRDSTPRHDVEIAPFLCAAAPVHRAAADALLAEHPVREVARPVVELLLLAGAREAAAGYAAEGGEQALAAGELGEAIRLFELARKRGDREVRIRAADLHHNVGYTPYEGRVVKGWPTTVLSRGRIVVDGGVLRAERGTGRFVPRARFSTPRPPREREETAWLGS